MAKARGHPFPPGNRASQGRPPGSANKATRIAQGLFAQYSEPLIKKCISEAMKGDSTAMRLSMERVLPPCQETPVEFDLPEMKTFRDTAAAGDAVLQAVSRGQLTQKQGQAFMALIERQSKLLEKGDLEERLQRLERAAESNLDSPTR